MSEQLTFTQAKEKNLKTLKQYVPVVARVHGPSHPEFHDVRKVFDIIVEKVNEEKPQLNEEFAKLREITDGYKVPGDVCESFEAVYKMLAELDNAYQA